MAANSGGRPPNSKWSYNPSNPMGKRWNVSIHKNGIQFVTNNRDEPNYYRKIKFDPKVIYILEMPDVFIPLTLFWNQSSYQMYYINGGICDINTINFNRINHDMVKLDQEAIDDLQDNYNLGLITVRSENEITNNTFSSALISNTIPNIDVRRINVNNTNNNNNNNNNNNTNNHSHSHSHSNNNNNNNNNTNNHSHRHSHSHSHNNNNNSNNNQQQDRGSVTTNMNVNKEAKNQAQQVRKTFSYSCYNIMVNTGNNIVTYNYKDNKTNDWKIEENTNGKGYMGKFEIYNARTLGFTNVHYYNQITKEFSLEFLMSYKGTFINFKDKNRRNSKWKVVNSFKEAAQQAVRGYCYCYKNGEKIIVFEKIDEMRVQLNQNPAKVINEIQDDNDELINYHNNVITIEKWDYLHMNLYHRFVKPNKLEFTNQFILNFGASIPLSIWNSNDFISNVVNKLNVNKTYMLLINEEGSIGIPCMFQKNGRKWYIHLSSSVGGIYEAKVFIDLYQTLDGRNRINFNAKKNLDFEGDIGMYDDKRETDDSRIPHKDFNDAPVTTITNERLMDEEYFAMEIIGRRIILKIDGKWYPGYPLNSNLVRIGNKIVWNMSLKHFVDDSEMTENLNISDDDNNWRKDEIILQKTIKSQMRKKLRNKSSREKEKEKEKEKEIDTNFNQTQMEIMQEVFGNTSQNSSDRGMEIAKMAMREMKEKNKARDSEDEDDDEDNNDDDEEDEGDVDEDDEDDDVGNQEENEEDDSGSHLGSDLEASMNLDGHETARGLNPKEVEMKVNGLQGSGQFQEQQHQQESGQQQQQQQQQQESGQQQQQESGQQQQQQESGQPQGKQQQQHKQGSGQPQRKKQQKYDNRSERQIYEDLLSNIGGQGMRIEKKREQELEEIIERLNTQERENMTQMLLEDYCNNKFSFAKVFEEIGNDSMRYEFFDNATNTMVKRDDEQYALKEIITKLAKNARSKGNDVIIFRFASRSFQQQREEADWRFSIKYHKMVKEIVEEIEPEGIFAKIDHDNDVINHKYSEDARDRAERLIMENHSKRMEYYEQQIKEYEKKLNEFMEIEYDERNQRKSYLNMANGNQNRQRIDPPVKPMEPQIQQLENMTNQQKLEDKTRSKFEISNGRDSGVVQNGIIEFGATLSNGDSVELHFLPTASFCKEENWKQRCLEEFSKYKQRNSKVMHKMPQDMTMEIVEPQEEYKYQIEMPNDQMKDNGDQWIIRERICEKIYSDNEEISDKQKRWESEADELEREVIEKYTNEVVNGVFSL